MIPISCRQVGLFVAAAAMLLLICTNAAEAFTFDDIQFCVGDGAQEAALVIDWTENSAEPPALVWGYRWDGTATGADMFEAVVQADDRMFAKLGGSTGNSNAVHGIGYDDGDGQFSLDDATVFDDGGLAFAEPVDGVAAIDPDDRYAEGWLVGFWHYGVASSNPFAGGNWISAPIGMADRTLTTGAWDGWTFDLLPFGFDSFPEDPEAAPPAHLPGDYNRDGTVDAIDYTLWRDTLGSSVEIPGSLADGDKDGFINSGDYEIWKQNYGRGTGIGVSLAVPEPSTRLPALLAATILIFLELRNHRWFGNFDVLCKGEDS